MIQHFACDGYGYTDGGEFDLVYRSELCLEREEKNLLQRKVKELARELEEAHREIAKLKASSNENYWELSRQRDNMRFALHKIDDAVRYGFKHGSKSGGS
jgi:uncharacterized protein YlxW (UPF0749 family)